MLICGIETSCDETAIAIVEDGKQIVASVIFSQEDIHRPFGGVVPEIACRTHLERIFLLLEEVFKKSNLSREKIDAWAVTYGPGLVGALLIGIAVAKSLSYVTGKPLLGINHIEGHLYANILEHEEISFPWVGLVVSGGHTSLYFSPRLGKYKLLGETADDAAGEAFDKVAKLLSLGYPGGPAIEEAAKSGDRKKIRFPRPKSRLLGPKDKRNPFGFSFSGLKTAVLYYLRDHPGELSRKADIAAGFQEAVVEVLVKRTAEAATRFGVRTVLVSGGVASNGRLREEFDKFGKESGINIFFPSPLLCTDNAAMIAGLGFSKLQKGETASLDLGPVPGLKL